MNPISIAIHGGAGTILRSEMSLEKETLYKNALKTALDLGYAVLESGGSALNAVETAVKSLEDCPLFNAGKGSVFNALGKHEMDASIMDGSNLMAGAVSGISNIKNPVSMARMIMEKSEHVFLMGAGAMEFAQKMNIPTEPDEYFFDQFRYDQWQKIKDTDNFQLDHVDQLEKKFGTVGAVALDCNGNLAAATSTGGMTNKKYGRVGDSPIIGAGTYANNRTCAVSCTGSGEFFIRNIVAYDVACIMDYKGLSIHVATEEVVNQKLTAIGGDGGLIAVNYLGDISMTFNTEGMYRAAKNSEGEYIVEIYK